MGDARPMQEGPLRCAGPRFARRGREAARRLPRQPALDCAWDALGIPAALHQPAEVLSRCEQTHEPLVLQVDEEGPEPSDFLFHCAVPAAQWWKDIVFT